MVVQPKIRGFICTTAHPVGCERHVQQQIHYVTEQKALHGPRNVLIIGASTGYGLASRITAAFASNAATIGVSFERPAQGNRTATAGWYNTAAFERAAHARGLYAKSINGDAFSDAVKQQTCELIKQDLQKIDLVIYSLASPRRTDPKTGTIYSSVLKTIDEPFSNKTMDPNTGVVSEVAIPPAKDNEINDTIAVMGGDDWNLWMECLQQHNLLADGVITLAYSYIGPRITFPIYREGTIGQAKKHLEKTARSLNHKLQALQAQAYVSINKAVITQSSAAIPVVPLYISLLYRVMKQQNRHEGCIEQMYRLFAKRVYSEKGIVSDINKLIRLDDQEMLDEVQSEVINRWLIVNSNNVDELGDPAAYRREFQQLFGFAIEGVDYEADVNIDVNIPSIQAT